MTTLLQTHDQDYAVVGSSLMWLCFPIWAPDVCSLIKALSVSVYVYQRLLYNCAALSQPRSAPSPNNTHHGGKARVTTTRYIINHRSWGGFSLGLSTPGGGWVRPGVPCRGGSRREISDWRGLMDPGPFETLHWEDERAGALISVQEAGGRKRGPELGVRPSK